MLFRRAALVLSLVLILAGSSVGAAQAASSSSTAAPDTTTAANITTAVTTSSDDQPLIIVLDISGSMDDADGSGGVKLASAKAAVERAVRARGVGSTVGIWAFPSQASCSSGGFVVPPEQIQDTATADPSGTTKDLTGVTDVSSVIAKVDALVTTDGGTPIGSALRDSSAAMTLQGFTSATMLLVTDGLNNCDPDPCTEAKAVQRSGFDLTVDAIGFRTDTDANDDLTCIAKATGGSFTSADDGAALQKTLAGLAVPHLTMQLAYAPTVRAGSSPQVSVTVTNPSSNEASDVRANLAFHRDTAKSIMPAVVPPTYRIGNVPPQGSVTRTWTLTTAASDAGTVGQFTATVWAADAGTTQQDGTFAVTDQEISPEGRLFKNLADYPLVILGDSFSSGEGGKNYLPATSDASAACHRSMNTYLADRMTASKVDIIACSGAVISDYTGAQFDDDGIWHANAQRSQLLSLSKAPGAVVLTLGGNDAGFKDVITGCVVRHLINLYKAGTAGALVVPSALLADAALATFAPNCSAASSAGQKELKTVASLQNTMLPLYEQVWRDANTPKFVAERHGAYAPVIVSTYPEEFLTAEYGGCSDVFDAAGADYGNKLATGLMAAAKESASRAAAAGYEVYFAATPLSAFLRDHTYCASDTLTDVRRIITSDPHIAPTPAGTLQSLLTSQESMHPNANGYAAETDALMTWQATVERFAPSARAKNEAAVAATSVSLFSIFTSPFQLNVPTIPIKAGTSTSLAHSQTAMLSASDFSPFTPVTFTLHSSPVVLGTALADAHGVARLRTTVPATVALGQHELRADGVDTSGNARSVIMQAAVNEAVPLWVAAAVGLAALLVLVCLVILIGTLVRARRRRTA